jgi:sister chromatid cohesion protein DCC1
MEQDLTFACDFDIWEGIMRGNAKERQVNMRVMEIDEALLALLLRNNGSICVKGLPSEEAGMSTGYFELEPVLPKTGIVRTLLSENAYEGEDNEENKQTKLYTWESLRDRVQASDAELHKALADLHAIQYKGFWRLLSRAYIHEVMDMVLTSARIRDWPIHAIPVRECQKEVGSYPALMVAHCLQVYSTPSSDCVSAPGEMLGLVRLDPRSICILRAEAELMKAPEKVWAVGEFMSHWSNLVQIDDLQLHPTLDMLQGLALVQAEGGQEGQLSFFPVWALAEEAGQRFQQLFRKQSKWTLPAIIPYIRDLVEGGLPSNCEKLLLRYARLSEHGGVRYYSAR